jgi:hypothetical protein
MSGFTYTLSQAQIDAWRALSASEQLKVMEGFMRFNDLATTPEVKEIQQHFRRGEALPKEGGR